MWLILGRNLPSLADLLGVAAERFSFIERGSPEILSAFAVLASKQRPDLDRF